MSMRERYETRQRSLYALAFDGGAQVYIGQTISPKRREKEHRRYWPRGFRMIVLGTIDGTEAQADDYEHAWRWKAHQEGFQVVATNRAGEAFVLHDLMRQMNPVRFEIARRLRWPKELRRQSSRRWIGWAIATAAALLLVVHVLLSWHAWI